MIKKWIIRFAVATIALAPMIPTIQAEETFTNDLAEQAQSFTETLRENFNTGNNENIVYSPFSYYLTLAVLEAGLTEDEKSQLTELLVYPGYEAEDYYSQLSDFLDNVTTQEEMPFNTMQVVLGPEDQDWHQDFIKAVEQLQGKVEAVDFQNEASYEQLNAEIADFTNHLIDPYFNEDRIAELTTNENLQLILMNLLYFKSNWVDTFSEDATSSDIYYGLEKETTVDMMFQSEYFAYLETESFQAVKLPYVNGAELLVVLPEEAATNEEMWAFYQEAASAADWTEAKVELSLPKWSMRASFELTETLALLGLENFTDSLGETQFSTHDDEELAISKILQSIMFKLDENGTEAAAVTEMNIEKTALPIEEDPIEMIVNRPFVYGIQYEGIPLFEGINWSLGE